LNINQSALLEFWFGADLESAAAHAELSRRWFGKNPAFDEQIRSLFGIFPDAAKNGDYDSWRDTDLGMLALVVGLDQFPRNLFRNTPQSFAYDHRALTLAREAIEAGALARLHPLQSVFLYMPLEHTEDLSLQHECVAGLEALAGGKTPLLADKIMGFVEYAVAHREVIAKFGRFPHRNKILGRESTAEELAYLASGRGSF